MSATLEQSRTRSSLRAAAEHAPEESREDVDRLLHVFTATPRRRTFSRASRRICSGPPWPSATSPAGAPLAPPTSTRRTRPSSRRAGPAGTPSSRSSPTTCRSSSTRSPRRSTRSAAPSTSSCTRSSPSAGTPSAPSRRSTPTRRLRTSSASSPSRGCTSRSTASASARTARSIVDEAARRSRQRPRRRRGLEQDARSAAAASPGSASESPSGGSRRRRWGVARVPAVAGRRPLHLPRLPRVRPPDEDGTDESAAAVAGHRARHSARRPADGRAHRLSPATPVSPQSKARSRASSSSPRPTPEHRATGPTTSTYIGVKRFDSEGHVIGERPLPRPLHLRRLPRQRRSTSRSCARRCGRVLERAGFTPGSHSGKDAVRASSRRTRATSCSRSTPTTSSTSPGHPQLQERHQVALFARTGRLRPVRLLPRLRAARPLHDRIRPNVIDSAASRRRSAGAGPSTRATPTPRWPGCTSSSCRRGGPVPQIDPRPAAA